VPQLRLREPEGAKVCGECAAPLAEALACPKCGTANPCAAHRGARLPDRL